MTMKTALPLLLPMIALTAAPSFGRPQEDAAALLDAQRSGLGSAEALAKLGVIASRGRVSFRGFPGEGAYTELNAPDGRARMETLFEGMPPSESCTNGKLYWMTGTGGVEIKRGWSAAADLRGYGLARHRAWRELYARAELVGPAQVEGRECYELQLFPKSPAELGLPVVAGEEAPAPDTWWLDRGSKELVRAASYATVSGAGWQRLVVDYSDWRTVSGVRFPFKTQLSFGPPDNALVIDIVCDGLEVDAKLEGDPFQPGEQVLVALARSGSGEKKGPDFALLQQKEMQTATVRVQCKPSEIAQQLAVILPEVMGYLQREGLAPAGAPFARYHSFGEEEIDLEAGIPVRAHIKGNARVKPSTLPGGELVSGNHWGPYEDLPRTHAEVADWLAAQGFSAQGGPWEVYWTDPGLERNPAKLRTQIFQPVAKRAGTVPASSSGASREPDAALKRFDVLVGTWKIEGGISGQVEFEWLEGGHFLLQRADLVHEERKIKGLEVIGRERLFGAEYASAEIKSRFYDNLGNTLDYVWELGDGTLTIWGGHKGSPIAFRGTFSADRNSLAGAWEWPGGGYASTMTRVLEAKTPAKRDPKSSR